MGTSNLLWGLRQPNSDLVGPTLIFGYTNQKMMRVEATNFFVSITKILVGATNFFISTTKFDSADQNFGSADQKYDFSNPHKKLQVPTKFLWLYRVEKQSDRLIGRCGRCYLIIAGRMKLEWNFSYFSAKLPKL